MIVKKSLSVIASVFVCLLFAGLVTAGVIIVWSQTSTVTVVPAGQIQTTIPTSLNILQGQNNSYTLKVTNPAVTNATMTLSVGVVGGTGISVYVPAALTQVLSAGGNYTWSVFIGATPTASGSATVQWQVTQVTI